MELIIVMVCVIGITLSAPMSDTEKREKAALRKLPALQHEEIHDKFGQYSLRYITAEGIVFSERGKLVPTATGGRVLVIEGEVSYIGDDGKTYVTKYSAGLDGTKVESKHLPVNNPIAVASTKSVILPKSTQ